MPSDFEMDPSPYHLGSCNARVPSAEEGLPRLCGKPAVERWLGLGALEVGGDQRRCIEHRREQPLRSG